jgi:hypothetical protein
MMWMNGVPVHVDRPEARMGDFLQPPGGGESEIAINDTEQDGMMWIHGVRSAWATG